MCWSGSIKQQAMELLICYKGPWVVLYMSEGDGDSRRAATKYNSTKGTNTPRNPWSELCFYLEAANYEELKKSFKKKKKPLSISSVIFLLTSRLLGRSTWCADISRLKGSYMREWKSCIPDETVASHYAFSFLCFAWCVSCKMIQQLTTELIHILKWNCSLERSLHHDRLVSFQHAW